MITRVLIANRGEIAVRVARTAHDFGLSTVAVFTQADAGSLHIDRCDQAVGISSYLDIAAIIGAAHKTGADAVHPGYGFLSENAAFAEAVQAAGLIWIGPPVSAIQLMGDKARAKILAREAGVPVVPGLEDENVDLEQVQGFCAEHGFPAVIKAVAGGGGKGMRVVRSRDEVAPALDAARREAESAFGDGRVLVERYLERPRHIEVQVLADQHDNVVHLGERECSLQRRHQKVIEEAPSPVVGAELRARMGAAAVQLARACGYQGVGTVEFIAQRDDPDQFCFLEMNTRLQVEHPVTELVYGVDLVAHQLQVADGQALTLHQAEIGPVGHAVEARLYAEDANHGFLPSVGTISAYREPDGLGVRIDSGVRIGSEVGTAYDPMVAKVIAFGDDRRQALQRLDRALATFELVGVTTNAAFARTLLARDDIRAGEQDTGLLERVLAELDTTPPWDLVPAAMLAAAGSGRPPGPWRRTLVDHGEARVGNGKVGIDGSSWDGAIRYETDSRVRVALDGVERAYAVTVSEDCVWINRDGYHLELRTAPVTRAGALSSLNALEAPMPGTVLLVPVADGDAVVEGDLLVVLESMKMELSIVAPHAGTVTGLSLRPGDRVTLGQPIAAVLKDSEDAA